jgi:hypothetical protein
LVIDPSSRKWGEGVGGFLLSLKWGGVWRYYNFLEVMRVKKRYKVYIFFFFIKKKDAGLFFS